MTLKQYIDDLAKQGILDGNRADIILNLHRQETSAKEAAEKVVMPILNEMWGMKDCNGNDCHFYNNGKTYYLKDFADRIDDALETI